MQIRFQQSPEETSRMNTQQLRENFLVQNIMQPGKIELIYSHYDRLIIGGAVPAAAAISLPDEDELKADFFLERREMGILQHSQHGTHRQHAQTRPAVKAHTRGLQRYDTA